MRGACDDSEAFWWPVSGLCCLHAKARRFSCRQYTPHEQMMFGDMQPIIADTWRQLKPQVPADLPVMRPTWLSRAHCEMFQSAC